MKKYALISVSDKTGIETLAMQLESLGYTILSTSNTAKYLKQFCPSLVQVSELTGFPEILDGRVKTLHPTIHAGILAKRNDATHMRTMEEHAIDCIDIVAVNLYPFSTVRNKPGSSHSEIVENIDIGGPSLIRAAAKNYTHVCVLTDPLDYPATVEHLKQEQRVPESWSGYLAQKAFAMVSRYDADIADYFLQLVEETPAISPIPPCVDVSCKLFSALRYGENPHQQAGFYSEISQGFSILHGKELSFNNYVDIDASFRAIRLFDPPTVVIIKHANPCGIGSGASLAEAYEKAFATDTLSPFGGIVVVNRSLDMETAKQINRIFTEIIIAPGFEPEVLDMLRKKKDRRLISYEPVMLETPVNPLEIKTLTWGYLAQEWDLVNEPNETWQVVTERQPSLREWKAMSFSWKAVSVIKSNGIVLATEDMVIGFGIGQTSRIDSTSIAIWKAQKFGHELSNATCASDGFFPYRDSIDELHKHGIKAIIQPGGSKGDEDCIKACNELGITMVFTGYRHFRH
ncbi:MAG: bifunctional phosphoribosylaminoimidazolecarboxamide formyltransferase/inosine monophosphate cyclohydrolase [Candidatus Cloacimonetes bacterium HGW-Cloacimonetes-3]|jgi:phosphoribosylaminoimidazolecarboxamide formyltransferase/IMP cyclohydrolase|nr:MAG: bifunctional phosphoribosylaminoimidazolecarboxamide formyltransferase/inosine monophosphate cyclohydrolase [Candidatus Cloacimonetes bacterium HGW-Cloacimonetes-3]